MLRRPPKSTRTDTLFPYTTLFRSHLRPNPVAYAGHRRGDTFDPAHHAHSLVQIDQTEIAVSASLCRTPHHGSGINRAQTGRSDPVELLPTTVRADDTRIKHDLAAAAAVWKMPIAFKQIAEIRLFGEIGRAHV